MQHIILGTDEARNLDCLRSLTFEEDVFISRGATDFQFAPADTDSYHLLHSAGLRPGPPAFRALQGVSLNWHYLDPAAARQSNTWKCGSDYLWINREVATAIGGFDFTFSTADSLLSEFAYRLLRHGGRLKYIPSLTDLPPRPLNVTLADELNFIHKYLGARYTRLAAWAAVRQRGWRQARQAWRQFSKGQTAFDRQQINIPFFRQPPPAGQVTVGYSAIIPTILRYEYLHKSIESLLRNPRPPAEIIVVDQTPAPQRDTGFYQQFPPGKVKVFFLDSPGQSTARNLAVQEAANELLLLFEDDGEAWDNMVEEHLKLMADKQVAVSTGVALAPHKTPDTLPNGIRGYHLTDVLATGNAMVRKKALLAAAGFDPAFDRGSGADDDLGRRMYLHGAEIVFNPYAIMTHHKAPRGGMRVHGAWWRNKTTALAEYPPATQLYAIRKFYPAACRPFLVFILFLKAAKRNTLWQQALLFLLLPYKYRLASRKARLLAAGA